MSFVLFLLPSLGCLLLLPVPLCASREYSLDELCRIALERSEQVKVSAENVYLAERGKDKVFSASLAVRSM